MSTTDASIDAKLLAPWPVQELRERLLQGDTLHRLTHPKKAVQGHDRREHQLEALALQLISDTYGSLAIETKRPISKALDLPGAAYPGSARPDLIMRVGGKAHILEVKATRTHDPRFDNVPSEGFKQYLNSIGEGNVRPTEVEHDLIKLLLYPTLSREVGSCLLIIIDGYDRTRGGRSWTAVFSSPRLFRETMKTKLIRERTDSLLSATTIDELQTTTASARFITCMVQPWVRSQSE